MKVYYCLAIALLVAVGCTESNDDATDTSTGTAARQPVGTGRADSSADSASTADTASDTETATTVSTDTSSDTATETVSDSVTDTATSTEPGTDVGTDSATDSSSATDSETASAVDTGTATGADTATVVDTVCTDSNGCGVDSDPYFTVDTDRPECVDLPWTVETNPINLLVLLDRSASMGKYPLDAAEKYADVVQNAIDTIVQQHTSSGIVNFALNVFPSNAVCDAEYGALDPTLQSSDVTCQGAGQYEDANSPVNVPLVPFGETETVSMDTYSYIHQALEVVGTCGGTPIQKSLRWAKAYLESLDLQNPTYVLLATDGAPGCNSNLNPDTCVSASVGLEATAAEMCLDDADSAKAIYELGSAGFTTFVVGVGETVAAFGDTMDVLAYYGAHEIVGTPESISDIPAAPDGGTWYYPANDAASLNAALEEITNDTISCVYDVDWASIPDKNGSDTVIKSCTQARIFGVAESTGEKVELTWMRSCDAEDPSAPDPHVHLGWTWEELEGKSWDEIQAVESNTASCRRVKLCNNSCEKLKVQEGLKEWSGISASFGCQPFVVIE